MGEVGLVLSYDVTRLARNCSDWYPLLDLCGYRGCLIADRDGIYDPGIAQWALCCWASRERSRKSNCTRCAAASRGPVEQGPARRVGVAAPDGLDPRCRRHSRPRIPISEVQGRIGLVFATFLECGPIPRSCGSSRPGLQPAPTNRPDEVAWRVPTADALYTILTNPATQGPSSTGARAPADTRRALQTTAVPMAEWTIVVKDRYPAYIDWHGFERIQAMLHDNYAEYTRKATRGAPRNGPALLQGMVCCGAMRS